MRLVVICCAFMTWITATSAYSSFRDEIPNGHSVKHPCSIKYSWLGVGHRAPNGGGPRNQFGVDFKNAGMRWTEALCRADSDQDGVSNGEELGDPACSWSKGQEPSRPAKSHPGVCEPLDSELCTGKNDWLDCTENLGIRECAAASEPDMLNVTLRFPATPIPSSVTNYYCQIFQLPSDGDFHLVATSPVVNNSDIVHHMLLFGCDERRQKVAATPGAYKCEMYPHPACVHTIGTWTVGSNGDCLTPDAGFRIGKFGYRTAALQVHWHNPSSRAGQTDSSGMTLYYTPNTRRYDAGIFIVGQEYLAIPPLRPSVSFRASCPSHCTEHMFKSNLYITRAVNHMHYLGKSQTISLHRDGNKVLDLTSDSDYNYDNPVFYHYDTPVEVQPGDELRTVCTYNSLNRKETVYFGGGTDNEMCYGFLTFYPARNVTQTHCFSRKTVHRCEKYLPKSGGLVQKCPWREYLDPHAAQFLQLKQDVAGNCTEPQSPGECSGACRDIVDKARESPCFRGDVGEWILSEMSDGAEIRSAFSACPARETSAGITIQTDLVLRMLNLLFFIVVYMRNE